MVSASDRGASKGAAGTERPTTDGGLPIVAPGVSAEEDEQTARKQSPAAKPTADAYGADESVTRIGPPVEPPYVDDSVTADGPAVRRPPPALQDDTESVTRRQPSRSPYDDDSSAQATAIIPSPHTPADGRPPVEVGRNVVGGMRLGAGVAAARGDLLEGTSDSGLRLTREHVPSGEHASLAIPESTTSPHVYPSGAYAQPAPEPLGSRYDLRVVIVAFVSFAIPFGLFLYLFSLFARD